MEICQRRGCGCSAGGGYLRRYMELIVRLELLLGVSVDVVSLSELSPRYRVKVLGWGVLKVASAVAEAWRLAVVELENVELCRLAAVS